LRRSIRARSIFNGCIEKDPGFALGYAGLADSYLANAIRSPQDFDPKAKAAASRALELDDDLAEAHAALGAEKADFEYDWPGAEQEFKRAIELNPNYAEAHFRYALSYLMPQGQSENAIAEMKKALQLDPFSPIYNTVFGLTYFYARRYDQAQEQFKKAIELNPNFFVTHYHLAWLYSQSGQYENAISELTRGRLLSGDDRTVKAAAPDEVALRKALWRQHWEPGDSGSNFCGRTKNSWAISASSTFRKFMHGWETNKGSGIARPQL
jgi:tetratricopeptide (TPR) repeat protein